MRRYAALLLLLTAAAAAYVVLHRTATQQQKTPTAFRAYLTQPTARIVAYTPTRAALADPQRMQAELHKLRERFDGLSLYQCTPETPELVRIAAEQHFHAVLLTLWDPRSESELSTAASILRDQSGQLALAVSIGSEGLMEKRYELADLVAARNELLSRQPVEITTTEPWWLYLKPESRALDSFGDFTSINIHAVWDTDIPTPEAAADWTRDRAADVKTQLGRPILLREAGFPGGGTTPRDAGNLTFSRTAQAGYWHAWQQLDRRPPAVVFEGIDNPEKHWHDFESTWGLLDENLQPWPAWNEFPPLH